MQNINSSNNSSRYIIFLVFHFWYENETPGIQMNERMSVDRAHRFGCEMMEQKDRCTSQPASQPKEKKKWIRIVWLWLSYWLGLNNHPHLLSFLIEKKGKFHLTLSHPHTQLSMINNLHILFPFWFNRFLARRTKYHHPNHHYHPDQKKIFLSNHNYLPFCPIIINDNESNLKQIHVQ